jgi:hypothetical protein
MKNKKMVFSIRSTDAGNGLVHIVCEFTVHRKTLACWLRFSAAALISVLITLNVPGLENVLHQMLV